MGESGEPDETHPDDESANSEADKTHPDDESANPEPDKAHSDDENADSEPDETHPVDESANSTPRIHPSAVPRFMAADYGSKLFPDDYFGKLFPADYFSKLFPDDHLSKLIPADYFSKRMPDDYWSKLLEQLRGMSNLPAGALTGLRPASKSSSKPRQSRPPEDFLLQHAENLNSVEDLIRAISTIETKHQGHQLIWRGQQQVWPVESSLRRSLTRGGAPPDEDTLNHAEKDILDLADSWGITIPGAMRFLAILQHNGAPTRLLDVSPDPYVAAWFATEPNDRHDDHAGLIIAWGRAPKVKARTFGNGNSLDTRSDASDLRWHRYENDSQRTGAEWGTGTRTWHWAPGAYNERMRAQRGGFILEATPLFDNAVASIISDALGKDWRPSEIARATSTLGVPSPIRYVTKKNKRNIVPMFTLRVTAGVKHQVQDFLMHRGLTHQVMYPDLAGLVNHLRSKYPT